MKNRALLLCLVAAFSLACFTAVRAENRHFDFVQLSKGDKAPFSYHLPNDYDPEKAYPVLVGPGDGREGSGSGLFWRSDDTGAYGWIIVESPVLFEAHAVENTRKLIELVETKFKIEGGGVHLVGWSANSAQIYKIAMELSDRVASITAIPGYPLTDDPEELRRLKDVKVHMVVGEKDDPWRADCERVAGELEKLGVTTRLDVVEGGGHVLSELIGVDFMKKMDRMR